MLWNASETEVAIKIWRVRAQLLRDQAWWPSSRGSAECATDGLGGLVGKCSRIPGYAPLRSPMCSVSSHGGLLVARTESTAMRPRMKSKSGHHMLPAGSFCGSPMMNLRCSEGGNIELSNVIFLRSGMLNLRQVLSSHYPHHWQSAFSLQ